MTSKCGTENKKVAHEAIADVLMLLPHFDVLCDLQYYYSITEQTGGLQHGIYRF